MKATSVLLFLATACLAQARTYQYDTEGRLIGVAYPTGDGIAYTYDEAGNLLQVEALDLPAAPSDLTASRSDNEIVLNWMDNSDDETGFQVYRRLDDSRTRAQWRLMATLAANTLTYTDTDNISPQAKYEYRVVATSNNGPSADSNIIEAVDPNARPFEISDHSVSLMNEDAIELTLTLTTIAGNAYAIEESTDLIRWTLTRSITADHVDNNGTYFLGDFTDDTTTVTLQLPASTERMFFRPVR